MSFCEFFLTDHYKTLQNIMFKIFQRIRQLPFISYTLVFKLKEKLLKKN